jgi:uncharacterized protein (TIGR02246 family)
MPTYPHVASKLYHCRTEPGIHRRGGSLPRLARRGDDLFMTELPEQLHINFQRAFNRHDLDSIVALYEPDAVLASVDGPVQGTDAIREAYRGFLSMRPTIDLQTLGVNRAGDLAMLHGKWTLHGTGPDGGQIRREGRNTEAARLQPNGRWLFVIDNPSVP